MLRQNGISYVVVGESSVDLADAVDQLGEHFGIRILLLEGGGQINGAFLEADLVDEVSLSVVPGIDGRPNIPTVFDGVNPARNTAVPLAQIGGAACQRHSLDPLHSGSVLNPTICLLELTAELQINDSTPFPFISGLFSRDRILAFH
jgi:RibD C-terminal domain